MKEGREGVCGRGTAPLKHGEAVEVDGDDHHHNDHNNDHHHDYRQLTRWWMWS